MNMLEPLSVNVTPFFSFSFLDKPQFITYDQFAQETLEFAQEELWFWD